MTVTTLTVQEIVRTGIVPTFSAATATDGDKWLNTGDQHLEVVNADSNPTTVAIATPATIEGQAIADTSVTVAAGTRKKIGPFPPALFNDSSGYVTAICTNVTSVTVGVFKV